MTPQTLLVTGASGFLGHRVVAEALRRGHAVRALTRRATDLPGAETVIGDLAQGGDWLRDALHGTDGVIHLAAALGSDPEDHARDTLRATETLLAAMTEAATPRLVHLSSLAVLSSATALEGTTLEESTPLEPHPETRDAYAQAKLAQEALVRAQDPAQTWLLRPGAIHGPGRTWNSHLGPTLGPLLLRIGAGGEVPLIHVESCAAAVIRAAETAPEGREPLLLTDDALPDRRRFAALHATTGWPKVTLPLPWPLWHALAKSLDRRGWLGAATARARLMPVRYSNARAQARLGWHPADTATTLRRSLEAAT